MIKEPLSLWQRLQQTSKPIVIYGMGDGADKILKICKQFSIKISGIFASDDYVRGHSFGGFEVMRLAEIKKQFEDFIILVAFAVHDEEMINRITALNGQYELYAPDVPVIGGGLFDLDYVQKNADQLAAAYSLLADEQSRRVFENVLNFKISGKLSYLRPITTPKQAVYQEFLQVTAQERYVDLGAYDGDTIEELLSATQGRYESIMAVEPDVRNFKKLSRFLSSRSISADARNIGVWSTQQVLSFSGKAGRNSALCSEGKQQLEVDSVDNLLKGQAVTLIKMDVEGAEGEVLEGCRQTIQKYAPKLIISAYHRNQDLFALPLQVHSLCKDYRLYFRRHPYIPAWELNLYAVGEKG